MNQHNDRCGYKKVNKSQLSASNSHRGWRPFHPEATRLRYEACGIKRPDFQSENGKITEAEYFQVFALPVFPRGRFHF